MTKVVTLHGKPVPELPEPPLEINVEQALESMDIMFMILWKAAKQDAGKLKHMRLKRPDGSFDTVRSVLYRIERHIDWIQDAISRNRR